ncbi:MAG TPA: hypothetical protein VM802_24575, partial [Chitinophaga sp.]|uniref:hypothetical protein n=1 Tax=Chitinophaga sp. TaxID=1869181 RepID=UPI002B95C873
AENYSTLFSGGKFQTSFGAMPSQNYNTKEEGSQERIAVYNKVGEFIKTGRLTVSGALTNIPVLRKIAAMLRFDSGIFTVKKGNAKISALAYIEEVDGLNIVARNVNRGKQDANIFSDPEDDSDDEREKMKPLKEKQRRKLLADLYRKRDALNRKIRLLEGQGNAEDSESKISDKEVSEEMVFEKSNSTSEVSEYSGDEDDLNDEVIEDTRKRKSKEQGAVTKKYHKRNNDM